MRVLVQIEHIDIIELDVKVLVDGFEGPADPDVVLELDRDGLVGEGFEEAVLCTRDWLVRSFQVFLSISDCYVEWWTYLKKSMIAVN